MRRRLRRFRLLILLLAGSASAQPSQDPAAPLNLLVFGATGEVGQHLVSEALERGHRVIAVSRNPASIESVNANLTAIAGDLLEPDSIASLIRDVDVVIVSVRGVVGDPRSPENALQYIAVRNVVAALRAESGAPAGGRVARLIHIGGAGSLEVEPGRLLADRLPRILLRRRLETEIDGQVLALEYLRTVDDVAWTYATPARRFTNGPRTGQFHIGGDAMLRDRRNRSRISRADFAVAVIDEAESGEHVGERFSVAY